MILVHLDIQDSILLKANDRSFHVLHSIMLQMDIESNVWYADRFNKQELCNKLHISLPSLDKMIASLKERELLILIQRGKYKLNEQLTNGY
jgi:hypothetical protein